MTIFVIGINHKTASILQREQVYFAPDKLSLYLHDLLARGLAEEVVLLSTCNRSEIYCSSDDIDGIHAWFSAQMNLPSAIYIYRDEEAIAHIMQVACGLDSMVLGEPQILGQMKAAFSESCAASAVGALFHRLFQQVFAVAKTIRTTTAIGACPVSIASAAVHFAKQYFPAWNTANVVVVGAGETAALLIRYLKMSLVKPITLVNRSLEKAVALISELGGTVYGLDRLAVALAEADVVFSATSSILPMVNKNLVAEVMHARQDRPMLFIDLAVPRNIEGAVTEIANVQLYTLDDLKIIIEKNRQGREHAADKAYEMIQQESRACMTELNSIDKVAHTISAYRGQIEAICRTELNKAKQQLHQGVDSVRVLELFAHAFTRKLLHAPSVQLRQAGVEGRMEFLRFAKELFAIPDVDTELL